MSEYVITLLAAAAVTYLLTPLVRRFAVAVGAMHAARERDVHDTPTPLLGGFAIYGGLAAALLLASRLSGLTSVFTETNMAKGLLLAGGLVVIMGFVDDRWGMGALSKLAGQVAAGVILVWSGAEITWLPAPGGVTFLLTSDQQVAVTILVVVVTMNAVNFIDGLDGLAAGIVGIGAVAFFAYYYTLIHRLGLLDQSEPALVSAVLAGVCLGFLPHNFHPARIFMGDTGSMLIGLMLAFAPISSIGLADPQSLTDTAAYAAGTVNRYGAFSPLLVPGVILLIPYADLFMAVVRRTRAGTSVFSPDKKHLQHRLLAIGHSHRTSVLIMYLWAALFAGGVVWLSIVRTPLFVLAIVTVSAVLALMLVTMPRLRPWARASPGGNETPRLAARAVQGSAAPAAAQGSAAPAAARGTAVPAAVPRGGAAATHEDVVGPRASVAGPPWEAAPPRPGSATPLGEPGWRGARHAPGNGDAGENKGAPENGGARGTGGAPGTGARPGTGGARGAVTRAAAEEAEPRRAGAWAAGDVAPGEAGAWASAFPGPIPGAARSFAAPRDADPAGPIAMPPWPPAPEPPPRRPPTPPRP